jgi:eukaryotic-like serine/threonine-protein kinase
VNAQSSRSLSSELAQRVEAFEVALAANSSADYADFLPAPEHRLFFPLLEELIRIDLERSWAGGEGKHVTDYLARHPEVSERSVLLTAIAFEEFRQRRLAGQAVSACEYRERLGLDTSDWPNPDDQSRQASEIPIRRPEWKNTAEARTPIPSGERGGFRSSP